MDPRVLAAAADSLSHRGPDHDGRWTRGSTGLACRLLHTTPESLREELPLEHRSGDFVLTADARIDNRHDLIASLGVRDRAGLAPTDGQLILAAYAHWGEACVGHLIGDFAFVIWDGRRQRLFCARDAMGVKPLYYCHRDSFFACASEIKALLTFPEVPRRLDELRLAGHLTNAIEGMADQERTFYRDIKRLPPGHVLVFDDERLRTSCYWRPEAGERLLLSSDLEYAEAFLDKLREAVRCRLRCAFPVGTELSGGLDSSSIACVGRRLLGGAADRDTEPAGSQLHTLSAVFPNLPEDELPYIDERPFIEAVVAGGGLVPHQVEADRVGPLDGLEHTLWLTDQPFFGPNLFLNRALYGVAREHGLRVVLSGLDGDTTVWNGLDHLADLARAGRWWTLLAEIRTLRERAGTSRSLPGLIWRMGLRPLIPAPLMRLWRRATGRRPPLGWAEPTLDRRFAERIGWDRRLRAARAESERARSSRDNHARAVASGHWTEGLELFDKTAAWLEIEPRYPFFDRRLIDFCLAIPPEQSLKFGWTRFVLRNATRGILPERVRTRPHKANLEAAFLHGMRHHDRERIAEIVNRDLEPVAGYADIDRLLEIHRRLTTGEPVDTGELTALFQGMVLAVWMGDTERFTLRRDT